MHKPFWRYLLAFLCLTTLSACGGGGGGGGGGDDVTAIDFDSDPVLTFSADITTPPVPSLNSTTLLMKAVPDECYVPYERTGTSPDYTYIRNTPVPPEVPVGGVCSDPEAIPKTNESYVWGLAQAGDRLWFGTGANVQCLVTGNYLNYSNPQTYRSYLFVDGGWVRVPTEVCTYSTGWPADATAPGEADFLSTEPLPGSLGDWRPPSVHFYDLNGDIEHYNLEDAWNEPGASEMETTAKSLLDRTLGLRSAGASEDVVFLAGPSFDLIDPSIKNVNIFAFKSSTAEFLGSYVLPGYSNIRKWQEIHGELYTTLTVNAAEAVNDVNGHVLKWTGTEADPFSFEVVGHLPGGGAELTEYGDNRMAVSTWPGGLNEEEGLPSLGDLEISQTAIDGLLDTINKIQPAGIYLSVPIPVGGLQSSNAGSNFKEVFNFADYDPDPLRVLTYGGGALSYFDDSLIWGSMHVPQTLGQIYQLNEFVYDLPIRSPQQRYPYLDPTGCTDFAERTYSDDGGTFYPTQEACISDVFYNTATQDARIAYNSALQVNDDYDVAEADRRISIFRGRNLATEVPEIDVLYGYDTFKTFSEPIPSSVQDWCLANYDFGTCFAASGDPSSIFPADFYEIGATFTDEPNGIGTPVFGPPGFGQPNNYTWEMRKVNGRLYLGTMEYYTIFTAPYGGQAGGDLFSFSASNLPAVTEDINGLGNPYNYGFRTMLPGEPNKLYIGTANPFNITPDQSGGWELLEVDVKEPLP